MCGTLLVRIFFSYTLIFNYLPCMHASLTFKLQFGNLLLINQLVLVVVVVIVSFMEIDYLTYSNEY